MEYAVLIEREPGAPTIAAYSPGVNSPSFATRR